MARTFRSRAAWPRIDGLVLVARHERARHDAQRMNLRQAVRDRVGQAVAQVIRIRTAAAVHERQHRNRVNRAAGSFARATCARRSGLQRAGQGQPPRRRYRSCAAARCRWRARHRNSAAARLCQLARRGPDDDPARAGASGGTASSSTGARLEVRARSASMSRCTRLRFARTSAALW